MTALTTEQRLARSRELGIIVDGQDLWLLSAYTWRRDPNGYIRTYKRLPDRTLVGIALHHYIVGQPTDANTVVDHGDRNQLNNRRSNLSYVSHWESAENRSSTTDAPGVELFPSGSWRAWARRGGVRYHIGTYPTKEEAINARREFLTLSLFPTSDSR